MSSNKDIIRDIMDEVKQIRLNEHDKLDQLCTYNAVRLHEVLSERGIDCDVIRGGVEMKDRETPETTEDLIETGTGHWWVEVIIDGEKYTADINAIGSDFDGEQILVRGTPKSYIPMTKNPERMSAFSR